MFFRLKELKEIRPQELDKFLAKGWFRMNQSIFTTGYLTFNEELFQAIWLRVVLGDVTPDKRYKDLKKRNRHFTVEIAPMSITSAQEELYAKYADCKPFEPSESLRSLLLGEKSETVYNTFVINVFDGHKLIAFGCFDMGEESAAGICSIYDPDYKKNSLGLYMIYEKIVYSKECGLRYFYPGYVVPGYPAFDYKLNIFPNAIEYYDFVGECWLAF